MDQTTRRNLRGFAKIALAIVILAAVGWVLIGVVEDRADASMAQTQAEEAFAVHSAQILGVDPALTDHAAAVAGGYNACFWIAEYGLDPVTLDGWDRYWHQPWEYEWLRAAVTWLCPAGGA